MDPASHAVRTTPPGSRRTAERRLRRAALGPAPWGGRLPTPLLLSTGEVPQRPPRDREVHLAARAHRRKLGKRAVALARPRPAVTNARRSLGVRDHPVELVDAVGGKVESPPDLRGISKHAQSECNDRASRDLPSPPAPGNPQHKVIVCIFKESRGQLPPVAEHPTFALDSEAHFSLQSRKPSPTQVAPRPAGREHLPGLRVVEGHTPAPGPQSRARASLTAFAISHAPEAPGGLLHGVRRGTFPGSSRRGEAR